MVLLGWWNMTINLSFNKNIFISRLPYIHWALVGIQHRHFFIVRFSRFSAIWKTIVRFRRFSHCFCFVKINWFFRPFSFNLLHNFLTAPSQSAMICTENVNFFITGFDNIFFDDYEYYYYFLGGHLYLVSELLLQASWCGDLPPG